MLAIVRSAGSELVKWMPVSAGGRRRKPVLPEAGTDNDADRDPAAVCQLKELVWADEPLVEAAAINRPAQILFLMSVISEPLLRVQPFLPTTSKFHPLPRADRN